ncbi:MAG: AraC family transcriptional regulator [Alphaproteobacteria bacterium]|nr:AraC family transcriptional regulator [Alphaproteobacteria bacterium]
MSLTGRALWVLESRLAEPPSLRALAAELGTSPYGLVRAFAARFGETPMAYLRRRRLSQAAKTLAQTDDQILSVALAAGYGSHAAFSRAFRETFGLTPEAARAQPLPSERLGSPAVPDEGAPPPCHPLRVETSARGALIDRLVGLKASPNALEPGGIPALWGVFAERAGPYFRSDAPRLTYGVLSGMAGDSPTYACAAPASAFTEPPPGFVSIALAARRYAVLESAAHVARIRDVWRAAWDSSEVHALGPQADAPELERYGPGFDPHSGDGGFSVMIPLADEDARTP